MSASAAEPRTGIETGTASPGDRPERGERGERRGRRRGRRGGRHGGGGGSGREGGVRESVNAAGAPSASYESGAAESSADTDSNGGREQHQEPEAVRETSAPAAERREPREPGDAPARHEQPTAAPLAHFEPAPPTETNTPRESKPYVVWSSAPPDRAASGSGRGPEE